MYDLIYWVHNSRGFFSQNVNENSKVDYSPFVV